ncbi:MAG: MlaE family lipid ABC transporter permease subunit [Kiritimatiellae bacterium]|jgi:phospholipid/cholesterol/gamma-HCH transport system permease protein|nr:MlaE family lipid ABC transporter permease subunit [Kiritimatiellia bacterium]
MKNDDKNIDVSFALDGSSVKCALTGDWTIKSVAAVESKIDDFFSDNKVSSISIDCSQIDSLDESGLAVFVGNRFVDENAVDVRLTGVPEKYKWLKAIYELDDEPEEPEKVSGFNSAMTVFGEKIMLVLDDTRRQTAYFGEIFSISSKALFNPKSVRWKDFLKVIEKAGYDALPIIIIIGFLFGLILAFQSAMPMKQFGAEIYIINLVSLTLFRELGPLLTAIIFAARSGAAFTAEIGTMKINEEIDALESMGLQPTLFLALPKILAGTILVPFLTLFMNVFGLIGTALVMSGMGYGLQVFMIQAAKYTKMSDFMWGETKAVFFGFIVASIGCYRGLNTKEGPGAVGDSTTASVVTSIIMLIVADGLFAVVAYFLGI